MKLKLVTHSYTNIKKGRHNNYVFLFLFNFTALLFIGIIAVFLFSCNRDNNTSISLVKEITFKTLVGSGYPEIYFEKELNQEIIYFSDDITEKKIKFFSKAGTLLKNTPLDSALKSIDNIGRITVISFDTIIINSNYTNQILIIDRNGKVWKNYSLENSLIDSLGNQYEIISSTYPVLQNPNSLIYSISWRNNLRLLDQESSEKTDVENLEDFFNNVSKSAYFVNLKNFLKDSTQLSFKNYNFYKKISEKNCVFAEPPSYFVFDDNIFVSSLYSSNLFSLNKTNLTYDKSINVNSDYSSIGTNPLLINEKVLGKIQDSITYKEKISGRIEKLLYDKTKSEYYLIIRHNSTIKDYDSNHIPFSIIVLNKNLTKKAEYLFNDFKYKYYYTLVCSEGLLLFKNDTTKRLIKDEKIIYDLLKLH